MMRTRHHLAKNNTIEKSMDPLSQLLYSHSFFITPKNPHLTEEASDGLAHHKVFSSHTARDRTRMCPQGPDHKFSVTHSFIVRI